MIREYKSPLTRKLNNGSREKVADPIYGARPLKRHNTKKLYNAIANEMLEGKNQEMSRMKGSAAEDQFKLVTEQ